MATVELISTESCLFEKGKEELFVSTMATSTGHPHLFFFPNFHTSHIMIGQGPINVPSSANTSRPTSDVSTRSTSAALSRMSFEPQAAPVAVDIAPQNAVAGGAPNPNVGHAAPFKADDLPLKGSFKRQRPETLITISEQWSAKRLTTDDAMDIRNNKNTLRSHRDLRDSKPLTPRESAAVLEVEFVSDSEDDEEDERSGIASGPTPATSNSGTMKDTFELDILASVATNSSNTSRDLAQKLRGLNAFNGTSSSAFRRLSPSSSANSTLNIKRGNIPSNAPMSNSFPRPGVHSTTVRNHIIVPRHRSSQSSPAVLGFMAPPTAPSFLPWLHKRVHDVLDELTRLGTPQRTPMVMAPHSAGGFRGGPSYAPRS